MQTSYFGPIVYLITYCSSGIKTRPHHYETKLEEDIG